MVFTHTAAAEAINGRDVYPFLQRDASRVLCGWGVTHSRTMESAQLENCIIPKRNQLENRHLNQAGTNAHLVVLFLQPPRPVAKHLTKNQGHVFAANSTWACSEAVTNVMVKGKADIKLRCGL